MKLAIYVACTILFSIIAMRQMRPCGYVAGRGDAFVLLGAAVSSIGCSGSAVTIPAVVALACAMVSALTDIHTGLIFDAVTGTAAIVVFAFSCLFGVALPAVGGAAVAGGFMWFLHAVTRGHGMGLGDVKLAAVIGGGIGMTSALTALGSAFVLGAVVTITGICLRRVKRGDAVPFGPYLACGTFLSLVFNGGMK